MLDPHSWSDLYASDITSNDFLLKVQSLLDSPSKVALARAFQGSEVEVLIDFLDAVSEFCAPRLGNPMHQTQVLMQANLNDEHRQRCLRLLYKICKARKVIPTSYTIQSEFVHVGNFRDRGGSAEVSDGEYLGHIVAIKDLRTNQGNFDKIFRVCSVNSVRSHCSTSDQRFCREIIYWKYLCHPNILPLLGVYASMELYYFRILSEWMPNGNLVGYTTAHPEANRLQSVSLLPLPPRVPLPINYLQLSEVASGVAYLHELMIVHGDLKGVIHMLGVRCAH